MKCINCKLELDGKWVYCPDCGTASPVKGRQQTEIKGLQHTFYEKIVMWDGISIYWVCLLIGAIPFAIHFFLESQNGGNSRTDLSLYLSLVITFALASLNWATRQFRQFLPELFDSMKIGINEFNENYVERMNNYLGTARVLKYGLFFGTINTLLGYTFGLIEPRLLPKISITVQLFLAGLVCGFAVCGIVAVIKFINRINGENILNIYSLDNCGGTSFIGELVVKYSLITLFVGLLINLCINGPFWIASPWSPTNDIAKLLMNFWKVFPFIMSLFVVMFPVLKIHKTLRTYKKRVTASIKVNLQSIAPNLEDAIEGLSSKKLDEFRVQYDLYQEMYNRGKGLSTWPYSLKEKSKYASLFAVTLTKFIPSLYSLPFDKLSQIIQVITSAETATK